MNEPQTTTQQNVLSTFSSMLQFILGFLLGVALIAGSAVGAAYYYFKKVSSNTPEKPVYTEENSQNTETAINQPAIVDENQASENNLQSDNLQSESETELTFDTEPESESTIEEDIPPNAFYANVTWPQGLSLRAEPNVNAAKVGGIGFNAKILILEESADKQWQKVRIPWSEQEGWVKAGNVEKTSN